MNTFKKIYCRIFQKCFKLVIPVLPYRTPEILKSTSLISHVCMDNHISKVMVITDFTVHQLGILNRMCEHLDHHSISYVIYDKTVANPTSDNVEEAKNLYLSSNCQALIGFGGGSSMDCAKAVGARLARPKKPLSKMEGILKIWKKLPLLICVPTTAGTGSETTLAAVIVDSKTRHKYAINDFYLVPDYAVLDPKPTLSLPPFITACTGMDALTHAIEAYIGNSTTKKTREYALKATKLIFEKVYGEKYDENGLDILINTSNPKEVTCKGGLLEMKTMSVAKMDEMKVCLLGTKDILVPSSFKYADVDSNVINGVVNEINAFTDLFYELNKEFSFNKRFGVTKDWESLRPYFSRDIAKSVKDGISRKDGKDEVEETLFFYPIREILCAIGGSEKMLEPEDE